MSTETVAQQDTYATDIVVVFLYFDKDSDMEIGLLTDAYSNYSLPEHRLKHGENSYEIVNKIIDQHLQLDRAGNNIKSNFSVTTEAVVDGLNRYAGNYPPSISLVFVVKSNHGKQKAGELNWVGAEKLHDIVQSSSLIKDHQEVLSLIFHDD